MSELTAIQRLTYDYAFFNDTFRVDELVALFTEDGVFDLSSAGLERYEGHAAIRAFFERERRAVTHLMHVTTNHRIDVSGDSASGTVYFLGTARSADGRENAARGYYDDSYVRVDGTWRFRSRTVVTLLPFAPMRPAR
jgi:ketosteroid isomerase-like protein